MSEPDNGEQDNARPVPRQDRFRFPCAASGSCPTQARVRIDARSVRPVARTPRNPPEIQARAPAGPSIF